ncbi:hypothetical protein JCM19037_495 [Geomicrobium sp. JCM 19037]|uniref:hypothetical protein n=1 Tax=Geomicrobium sp. JCM 19037 TaxID=1460634 RepID=UPI00045F2F88|nr:hypothetical protein [Geomicrobium sp. JCM 19037]GAK02270.1 hypothetical protein JCM19037_495 [Geomicrobium sp. JCM 19037]
MTRKWPWLWIGLILILAGCQQSIFKHAESDTWEIEFEAVQAHESQETAFYTFHYLPDNYEEVESIDVVTDYSFEIRGTTFDSGSSAITTEAGCTGCALTDEDRTIEVTMIWTMAEGEQFEEVLELE